MEFPADLKYTKDHEWVRISGKQAVVGVSKYALDQLGDIVHVELPQSGDEFSNGDSFGTIESTKTVSDLYMPLSGKVVAVNDDIVENLESIGDDPYGEGWLIKIEIENDSEAGELLDAEGYESFIASEEN